MFGLFKKKEKSIPVTDAVWMSKEAKWNGCLQHLKDKPETVLIAWFEESRQELEQYLAAGNATGKVVMADFTHSLSAPAIFIEHFPLKEEEQRKYAELGMQEATVFSSLDEPLFSLFASDRIISMMERMGMSKTEMLQHSMISASIARAQEKVAEKIQVAVSARSQGDWLNNALNGTQV